METVETRRAPRAELSLALRGVALAATLEAALTIGHFSYGALLYDDPSRNHVVVPASIALALSLGLAALCAWRPGAVVRWLVVATAGIPFVGMFGFFHGGFLHGAKLLAFAAGASTERLLEWFDSNDFAIPNDVAFEASGLMTFVVSLAVAYFLLRLVRIGRRSEAPVPAPSPDTSVAAPGS